MQTTVHRFTDLEELKLWWILDGELTWELIGYFGVCSLYGFWSGFALGKLIIGEIPVGMDFLVNPFSLLAAIPLVLLACSIVLCALCYAGCVMTTAFFDLRDALAGEALPRPLPLCEKFHG